MLKQVLGESGETTEVGEEDKQSHHSDIIMACPRTPRQHAGMHTHILTDAVQIISVLICQVATLMTGVISKIIPDTRLCHFGQVTQTQSVLISQQVNINLELVKIQVTSVVFFPVPGYDEYTSSFPRNVAK